MALNPGDIAFVQFNADGTDDFAFVALVDIPADEEIRFTDNGWLGDDSGFRANEGVITWSAPAGGLTAGTVVTVTTAPATSHGSVTEFSDLNFAAAGDQILAWQDVGGSVQFLAALNNDGTGFQADATSSNTSALPPGLTVGLDAVALSEIDNAVYAGPTSGDRAMLLAAINDPANWVGDDAANLVFSGVFSIDVPASSFTWFSEDFQDFAGAGFVPGGGSGQLDSSLWRVTGMSDGDSTYGGSVTTGDHARGQAALGTVTTGGTYAFDTGEGNRILGVQPGASDFTPGTFTLQLTNTTGDTLTAVDVAYDIFFNNEQGRSTSLDFAWSTDDVTYTAVDTADFTTPEAADANGVQQVARNVSLDGLDLAPGATVYLQWRGDDVAGAGSRDEYGIDNLVVTAETGEGTGGNEPVLSVAAVDADKPEGDAGTTAFTFEVSRTGDASGTASVSYSVAGDVDGDDFAGGALPGGVVEFADGETSRLIEIDVAGDTNAEADEAFTLTLNDATGATIGVGSAQGTIRNDELVITAIHDIQGNASTQLPNTGNSGAHDDRSPLTGQTVTIEGVVVADFQEDGQLRGLFVQEEASDHDSDITTSEGIFIFTGTVPPLDVSEGDKVRITGAVSEFFGMTQLTATTPGSIVLTGSDTAANLAQVPATPITLPPAGSDPDDYFEQFEGMLVEFGNTLVVSEYFEVARYGQLVLSDAERPFQYTHIDDTPTAAEYESFLQELAHSRIILDDDNNIQNAPLPDGTFYYPHPAGLGIGTQGVDYYRGGDTIDDLTGVLHWSFAGQSGTDAWRVRPTETNPIEFSVVNARPETAPDVGGNVKVASFNVLNYFTSIDDGSDTAGPAGNMEGRGADSAEELAQQTVKLVEALKGMDADIIGLVEIENNGGDADGGAIAAVVAALNADLGEARYAYVDTGDVGTDAITVGIIYDSFVVSPAGAAAVLDDPAFTDPNDTGLQRSRPAVAQTFTVTAEDNADFGGSFNVVVNHLKSKGASGLAGGSLANPDVDQGDGQGFWNDTRTKAADYMVNTWIPGDPTGQGDEDWLIIGDLNAYRGETPITTLTGAGYTDLVRSYGGDDAYSYVFNGQLGYLDHALANGAMAAQVTGVAEWHVNADEVPVFDYNNYVDDGAGESSFEAEPTGNPLFEPNAIRTSDHDPVLIGLDLANAVVVKVSLGNGNDTYVGTFNHDHVNGGNGNDNLTGAGGDDILNGGNGNDVLDGGQGMDQLFGGNGNDIMNGGAGNDLLEGGNGRDTMSGGDGNDRLEGGNDDDVMEGGAGNDVLSGGNGNDTMRGGDGDDNLEGGNGNDIFVGGPGNDIMRGGNGNDRFDIGQDTGIDRILDFNYRNDSIGLAGGLTYAELSLVQDGRDTLVQLDATDTTLVVLVGVSVGVLGASDFVAA